MSTSRIALVAEDQRLAGAVQTHLKKAAGQPAFQCKFDAIRAHLGRDADGVLLLLLTTPADADHASRLVQEICLQQLLPTTVLLLADGCASDHLSQFDGYIAQRLHWPQDLAALTALVKDRVGRVRGFPSTREETLEQVIARRLLSLTPSLMPMVERIALAAAHDVTVLLTGETGTGKTYLARLMHDCSPRSQYPFLSVPCGAQPASLVESAFFGHVKGAFTGADRPKIGKFAAAGQGTLLLDEIDTLGLEQQAGLLRVIESGEYEPVGSNETHICTARIVVASNWDIEAAVEAGKFRQDLYYRLNVMSFHLPPLRERIQDIKPLARGMAARFNTKFKKELLNIHPETIRLLESFNWPGNIRQLENVLQQAVLVSSGPELLAEHLPQHVREYSPPVPANGQTNGHANGDSLLHNREVVERNIILRVLQDHGWSRARAASALRISRVTLYKKMKKYKLMDSSARSSSN